MSPVAHEFPGRPGRNVSSKKIKRGLLALKLNMEMWRIVIISTFFGIIIRMYFGDHNPPHFHVEFQGEKATFNFDGQLLVGNISSGTARKLVRDWARRHRLELMINWRNIEKGRPLNRIKPLE